MKPWKRITRKSGGFIGRSWDPVGDANREAILTEGRWKGGRRDPRTDVTEKGTSRIFRADPNVVRESPSGLQQVFGEIQEALDKGDKNGAIAVASKHAAKWAEAEAPFAYKVEHVGWAPTCAHYDADYRRDYPQARSARKRAQRAASGDWWKRVKRQVGKPEWETVPAVVLDPFAGSGTTLVVAAELGRRAVGLELHPDYCKMSKRRILNTDVPIPGLLSD